MAKLSKIRHFQIAAETTFGVEGATYVALRVAEDSEFRPETTALENAIARAGDYAVGRIIGGSRGEITLRVPLHGFSASTPSSAPAVVSADDGAAAAWDILMGLLGSGLGTLHAAGYITGTTVGATGTPVSALTANGGAELGSFDAGQALIWATGTTRRAYEMGWLKAKTTATPDSGTLLQTPRRSPQGDTLWGTYNVAQRTMSPYHESGTVKGWSVKLTGHDSADVFKCLGCYVKNIKFSFAVNAVPMVEITLGVAHYSRPGSGGGPSVPSWTYPDATPAGMDWQLGIGSGASVVYPTAKAVELDLGMEVVALEGGHSDSGIEGFAKTLCRPRLTTQLHFADSWYSAFTSQESQPITFMHGPGPGRMFGFCLPAARVVDLPQRGDLDGVTVLDIVAEGHLYTGDTGSDYTKPINGSVKLAFG